MLAARVGPEPSSLTTGSCDDPRPRCLGLRPRPPRQLSRRLAGECRPPASTGRAAAISRSTSAPSPGPDLLGRALTALGRLAGQPRHRSARDGSGLAPPGFPALLALEVQGAPGRSAAASISELRHLIRRMAQENPTWGRRRIKRNSAFLGYKVAELTVAKYMRRIPRSALLDVASLSRCAYPRDRRRRLLRRPDPHLPPALRLHRSCDMAVENSST